jgi:type VI secretion system secreted protein Hcp
MFDAFVKIEGIPGESTDAKHSTWIEVLSFHWGINQPASLSRSSAGSRSAERVNHDDFSIVKAIDKATPKIFEKCCTGEHIKEIKLELCRATGDKQKYMEYLLKDVIIASQSPGGAAKDAETIPLEEVKFSYGEINLTYTETDHQTGKPKGDVKAGWSLVKNQKV